MTEEQTQRIAALSEDAFNKKQHCEMLAMRNVYGLSPDEARKASIAYDLAHAEYLEAEALLRSAKASIAVGQD